MAKTDNRVEAHLHGFRRGCSLARGKAERRDGVRTQVRLHPEHFCRLEGVEGVRWRVLRVFGGVC